jgi:hypothetical protein
VSYIVDDQGKLDNFAIEPKVYVADYPTPGEQRRYALQGAVAVAFVGLLFFITFAVS